ncbi:MAG: SpoIID/LytB domain-containing protein [Candidatus Eisenbacteria bacterium]
MRRLARVLLYGFAFALTSPPACADAPPPVAATRHDWLDVGIAIDLSEVTLVPEGDVAVRGVPEIASAGGSTSIAVRLAGKRMLVSLADATGRSTSQSWVADDTVFVGGPDSPAIRVGGKRYRGGAKVFLNPRGKLTCANRVALEDYLRGVLPHEIGRLEAATLEAGKAQAVAARTYTLSYVGRRAAEGFDLYDSVEDQVYGGTVSESPVTDQSVRETRGVVALYQGSYIRANYFSTCGGATVNVEDIWPDPAFPWLRQVVDAPSVGVSMADAWCKGSPHFRWVERYGAAEALANLNQFGPAQSGQSAPRGGWRTLEDIRVASRSPSGHVRELVFKTGEGDVSVMADKTRWVLRRPKSAGGGILRSSLFKVAVTKDRKGRVLEVIISGGGNGHGAGMCQVGALAQSRAGRNYQEILRSYYTGIDLVRL